jgi:hypothetical protein
MRFDGRDQIEQFDLDHRLKISITDQALSKGKDAVPPDLVDNVETGSHPKSDIVTSKILFKF